ncbi:MAG: gamma-glutamylcyclotransferase family protein, partial [Verrucomicrobiota bacterium]
SDCSRENATLHGFRNLRVKGATFPGILKTDQQDDVVKGVLYLEVSDEAIERLDRFEDTFYVRESVAVTCSDSTYDAEAYVVPVEHARVLSNETWDRTQFERDHLADFLARCCGL